MAKKPGARDAVLDAFEELLIQAGERSATLDTVAKRAGVSKGGLLYHFPNKYALITATLERLDRLASEDRGQMTSAPEGPAVYFIQSSLRSNSPLQRSLMAVTRLAEGADKEARRYFVSTQQRLLELIGADIGEEAAKAVLYMGNGLNFNAMWESGPSWNADGRQGDAEQLLSAVERLRS
ncbi:TetR/AcrR family transcriptional regulator [Arthrobacter sp. CDRTa11]|uniref:TetR/AcrR family transcriptional regulator n=1 Tax=Arthrobacter sp. CDRTa11 TaxID=2651199 RepID=UPI002265C588|nr:TetR/AcrR family transcriptional regulator [Arthrobacter sp. CDRTa11]UZX04709.1 TetR/AcrR family transcriptional regulator [Arthrobacter sp. CDRTa11]